MPQQEAEGPLLVNGKQQILHRIVRRAVFRGAELLQDRAILAEHENRLRLSEAAAKLPGKAARKQPILGRALAFSAKPAPEHLAQRILCGNERELLGFDLIAGNKLAQIILLPVGLRRDHGGPGARRERGQHFGQIIDICH